MQGISGEEKVKVLISTNILFYIKSHIKVCDLFKRIIHRFFANIKRKRDNDVNFTTSNYTSSRFLVLDIVVIACNLSQFAFIPLCVCMNPNASN